MLPPPVLLLLDRAAGLLVAKLDDVLRILRGMLKPAGAACHLPLVVFLVFASLVRWSAGLAGWLVGGGGGIGYLLDGLGC